MKKVVFVTSNKGKFSSAKRFLKKYNISVIQKDVDIPEIRGSLEDVAIQKAKYSYRLLEKSVLVMDAGFFVQSLKGFPMMFTNFVLETIGNKGIIKLTEGKSKKCEFREVLCYAENSRKRPKVFKSVVSGTLSDKPRGKLKPHHWSKLALIFIPQNEKKTMAEMNDKEFSDFRQRVDNSSHWEQFGRYYTKK